MAWLIVVKYLDWMQFLSWDFYGFGKACQVSPFVLTFQTDNLT
ncbi:hypothetical protein [Belliella marina]